MPTTHFSAKRITTGFPHAKVVLAVVTVLASILPLTADAEQLIANASPPSGAVSKASEPFLVLGIGDAISVQVYGRPELGIVSYIADDGTVSMPLAGNVPVAGLSPSLAGQKIAAALRNGNFLIDPQVTVLLPQFRGPQVSVLGAVHTPGRFVIDAKTTVLDLLAQAGGTTESSTDVAVLLRPDSSGTLTRYPINLKGLSRDNLPLAALTVRGGDSIFVPPADQFYIYGEVRAPNMYRLEPGMTVEQAISRGGGINPRGSSARIELKRRRPDGSVAVEAGTLNDAVEANDVIRIKERIF